ncbi:MAG: helix-turn-helix domain-containing protein [Phycisphaeraceae bacterium]|nr:helix-turn-helix domain-containing protein [Phycisphaeraceae bacterium]
MAYLSTAEAADRLNVTQPHVALLIRKGDLKGTKVGRNWIIDERSIEAFERRERPGPGRPAKDGS